MNTSELEQYIEKKRKEYDLDSQDLFDSWLKRLENYEAKKDLLQHKVIIDLVADLEAELKAMRDQIADTREFNQNAEIDKRLRNYLFDKIELYKRFVQVLKVGDEVKKINKEIEKYE